MSSQNNQPSNNSTKSTNGELIDFGAFDVEIERHLTEKQHLAYTLIKEEDKPTIVDALRCYLIRELGCFVTKGFYRPASLDLWYDRQALIEEFDDLLLEFREFVNSTKGIDTTSHYTLVRYRTNVHFICIEGIEQRKVLLSEHDDNEVLVKRAVDDLIGHTDEFKQRLEDKCGDLFNVQEVLKDIFNTQRLEESVRRNLYWE